MPVQTSTIATILVQLLLLDMKVILRAIIVTTWEYFKLGFWGNLVESVVLWIPDC